MPVVAPDRPVKLVAVCNTFHVPEIFEPFRKAVTANPQIDIEIVHVLQTVKDYLLNLGGPKWTVIGTTGRAESNWSVGAWA